MLCVAPVSIRKQRLGLLDVTIRGKPNLSIGYFRYMFISIYVYILLASHLEIQYQQIALN